MATAQKIIILDFGGQYTQLIARRVRECHVYSEVMPWSASAAAVRARGPAGVILSGGPASVNDPGAPRCDPAIYDLGVPVLGICYGMQLTAALLGGSVERAREREYGRVTVRMTARDGLLKGLSDRSACWMSHTWQVSACPPGFHAIAKTDNCPVAAMANDARRVYGVQFHPEVTHTDEGQILLKNPVVNLLCQSFYGRGKICVEQLRVLLNYHRVGSKEVDYSDADIDYAKALDCVDHNKLENSSKDGNTTPPYLP